MEIKYLQTNQHFIDEVLFGLKSYWEQTFKYFWYHAFNHLAHYLPKPK